MEVCFGKVAPKGKGDFSLSKKGYPISAASNNIFSHAKNVVVEGDIGNHIVVANNVVSRAPPSSFEYSVRPG